jgi:peptide/nickel transport system ATP-binding protein
MRIGDIIAEGPLAHGLVGRAEAAEYVKQWLAAVGLDPTFANRFPHQFSGGQRQRIAIARALAMQPDVIVCDEPVASLDVSIQAQIINLLLDLQEKYGLTYLFIAHDLAVVRHISTRVGVMYLGRLAELATREELFENPLHPYTKALLSAVPETDPELERTRNRQILQGDVPSPLSPPSGCRFHTRCPIAMEVCGKVVPEWKEAKPGHLVACHAVNTGQENAGLNG